MWVFVKKWYLPNQAIQCRTEKKIDFSSLECCCSCVCAQVSRKLNQTGYVSYFIRLRKGKERMWNRKSHRKLKIVQIIIAHIWLCSLVSFFDGTHGIRNASVNIKDKFSVIFHIQRVTESWAINTNRTIVDASCECKYAMWFRQERRQWDDLLSIPLEDLLSSTNLCVIIFVDCGCCVRFATRQGKNKRILVMNLSRYIQPLLLCVNKKCVRT